MIEENFEEIKSCFTMILNPDRLSIEILDNFEMKKEYKELVCIPYFAEKYKVLMAIIYIYRICVLIRIIPRKELVSKLSDK